VQLDKFQKNDVFLAITEAGLAPDRFELSFDPLEGKTLLGHKGSSAFIAIESTDYENLWIEYRVADGPLQSSMHEEDGWLPPVENWLALLKRDLETPDLWATLQQQQTMLDSPSVDANANTPFTAEEQQQIRTQLGEIKAYAKETNKLSGDQMRLLEGQLNYLHDAASRMGRIDWRNAVTGVLLGTVVNAVLPGEVARDALLMLLRSVGHMFGHPIPELSLGL
jgi:hypothetical protein